MTPLESARDHHLALHAGFAPEAEPGWLAALRREALGHFRDAGFPGTRLEDWRYTNVAPIARIPFEVGLPSAPLERSDVESHSVPVFACGLFVFVDGHYRAELSAPPALAQGPHVESLAALRREEPAAVEGRLGRCVDTKRHPFAALNTAFLDDAAVLRVPRGHAADQPIHVVFVSTPAAAPRVTHPRLLIDAAEGSQVDVIQDHVALGDAPAWTNALSEVHVGRDARVNLVVVQREPDSFFHVSGLHARLDRDARLSAHTLTLDGALVRNDVGVLLEGEGAECSLQGLFLGGGAQLIDNHTLIDHAVPHGTSRELYKGILGGRARGVFRGRVVVRPDAQKTSAYQSNPNLLVGRGAEIDTKPQLEIHASDVKCSHGATIGQLDVEALFYLRSRGIGEERARDLLTRAFAGEVLDGLSIPALAEGLDALLLERLRALREEA